MSEYEELRKSSTILAMDIANYSSKMGSNEDVTLRELKICRKIINDVVSIQKGRIFNTAGDAFMVEFNNTLSAVKAAVEIQETIALHNDKVDEKDQLEFRMGVNMGDVIVDGDNLLGDGVNVAARLEGISPPGGVCISETVYTIVKSKIKFGVIDKGLQKLKNIKDPIRAFFLDLKTGSVDPRKYKIPNKKNNNISLIVAGLALVVFGFLWFLNPNQQPSEISVNTIVVLPLKNLGDGDSSNLAAGLSQDLANGLSNNAKNLNVISFNDGTTEELSSIVKKTKAQYILSGSLRKFGESIRVSVNLIDTENMATLWTNNFDKSLTAGNIFVLQDDIVGGVINELVGGGAVLTKNVAQRIRNKGTTDLTAYECVNYVRATFNMDTEGHEKAVACLRESVKTDPNYAEAWELLSEQLGLSYSIFRISGSEVLNEALDAANKSIALNPNIAKAYITKAAILFYQKKFKDMFAANEKALELAPNNVTILARLAQDYMWGGNCSAEEILDLDAKPGTYTVGDCRWQSAVEHGLKANKLDTGNSVVNENFALAIHYIMKKQYDNTLKYMGMLSAPGFFWWDIYMGVAYDGKGDTLKATERFESIKTVLGSNSLSECKQQFDFWNIGESYYPAFKPVLEKYGFI